MSKKNSGSAAANGRKVEKNAGAKAAGTVKAGAVKAETPKAAKAEAVEKVIKDRAAKIGIDPAKVTVATVPPVKCSPAAAKASNDAIKAAAAKIGAGKAEPPKPEAAEPPEVDMLAEWRKLADPLAAYMNASQKKRKAARAAAEKAVAAARLSMLAGAIAQCVWAKERNGGKNPKSDTLLEVLAPEAAKRGLVYGTPDKVPPEIGAYVEAHEAARQFGRVVGIGPKNVRIQPDSGEEQTIPRQFVKAVVKAAQKPAEAAAKPDKPTAQPEAAKPAEKPEARNPFDYSADIAEWSKIAKTNPHEARADIATWASLLPVPDDSNLVFVTCLDTFASVAYLLEKAGRRIVALEKMSDDAARTFKAELAKVVDAKAAAELAACL